MRSYLILIFFLIVAFSASGSNYNTTFYDEDSGLSQWHVTQMLQDKNGMMWFATWNGLNRFDGTEFVVFKSKAGDGNRMPTDRFRDMILADNNDIYCRMDELWYRFSQKDGKFYNTISKTSQKLNALHHRQSKYLKGKDGKYFEMKDKQGNMWYIMKNGILKSTPTHSPLVQIDHLGPSSLIRAFFIDSKHRVWISSKENKCLYLFDSHLNFIKTIPVNASAYCIREDKNGNILLGCKPEGVMIGNENGFRSICPKLDVYDILLSDNNSFWLATFQGIYHINYQGKSTLLPKALKNVRFRKLYRKGNLILGASTNGLYAINATTGNYIIHTKEANRANSLSSSACMNILEHKGHIFIATESGGINEILNDNLFDRQLRFRHFDTSTGLPSDIAMSMVSMGDHILIVSSNSIIILNPKTGSSRSFSKHFFQKSVRFSEAMPLRLSDGRWLFGLQDGAIAINEQSMKASGYKPYLALTKMRIENNPVQLQIDSKKEITLNSHERTIAISFAALDYSDPDHILYAYRMHDDKGWNYLGHNHSIFFSELKPGDYQLFIQSTNADGTWCGNTRKLTIHVIPKFTETIWFIILCIAIVLLILGGSVYTYYYIKRMKEQQRVTLEAYLALLNKQPKEDEIELKESTVPKLSEQDDALMQRVIAFVEQHISDADVGVAEMADAALMSKSNLTRKLKELVGLTPADFLKEARIKRAEEMLKNSKNNISEVAYACGFNDPKYFSRVFKSTTGKSPSEYRE